MSIHYFLLSIFNWAVCLFMLNSRCSLYIMHTIPLSGICILNIFPNLFIFLIVSFDKQTFLILIKSDVS